MYRENIKANAFTIAKRDENNMYFYPNNSYRIIGIILPFLFSFFALVFFVLLDFKFNMHLVLYIVFYIVFCFSLILLSFDYVRVTERGVLVKRLFSKREYSFYDIKDILRETKRIYMYRRHTFRVVSYYFQLKDGGRVLLLKNIMENGVCEYDGSLESKLDSFVKILNSDNGLKIVFRDIDYEKNDELDIKADYVRRYIRLDTQVDKMEENREAQLRGEEKKKHKKKSIIGMIIISILLTIGIIIRLSKGLDFYTILFIILLFISIYKVYEETR